MPEEEKVVTNRRGTKVSLSANDVQIGTLGADILRILWQYGRPCSLNEIYYALYRGNFNKKRQTQSIHTLTLSLGKLVDKNMVRAIPRPVGKKGRPSARNGGYGLPSVPKLYEAARPRELVVASILNDNIIRLTGQSLGFILSRMNKDNQLGIVPTDDVSDFMMELSQNDTEYDHDYDLEED
jgi:hypothetical protein